MDMETTLPEPPPATNPAFRRQLTAILILPLFEALPVLAFLLALLGRSKSGAFAYVVMGLLFALPSLGVWFGQSWGYVTARYPNGFVSGAPADYFTAKTSERLLGHAQRILEFWRSKIR